MFDLISRVNLVNRYTTSLLLLIHMAKGEVDISVSHVDLLTVKFDRFNDLSVERERKKKCWSLTSCVLCNRTIVDHY